jgi:transposase-like protein
MISYQAKTREQVASEYGISARTLRRWLKKSGIKLPDRLLCPKEQTIIYQEFGFPRPLDLR